MLLPETLKLHDQARFDFHYIYFLPWKNQMHEALSQNGGRVTCFKANNNIQMIMQARNVAAYVRENKIQLIHAHLPWAGVVARIVGKLTGVPVIYTEHNKQERYHYLTRTMNLLTMPWLSLLIAVSGDVAESVKKHKKKLKTPVTTVLNGVNTDAFKPGLFDGREIRESLNISGNATVIGTVAVFRFQKRLGVWLEIAKQIHEKLPESRFIIVGDGPLKIELHTKATDLGLDGIVHFVGLQTEVRPYFAAMDIYMMSSEFEGLPIALLEAMASECAVISTDAGGIKEVVRDSQDGLICPVSEPEKLASMALDLLGNSAKLCGLRKQARRRVQESFGMEKMVQELEGIYLTLGKS
jgi:L-malate glycosyltransferase